MDILDVLTDLENVVPFFQPIFSADEHRIIGYEILGRYHSPDSGVVSLGPFFLDSQIPEEYRLEVDNTVLIKALNKSLMLEKDMLLFINRDADILMLDDGEQFLEQILQFSKQGISPDRIVLEISARNYIGELEHLDHLLNYYRTYGIKIAFDKIGDDSSHLDRIGQLSPDILKVNLQVLRSTAAGAAYRDILYSLSLLARKIGATLLFENIETSFQLQFAWKNGGHYYQGYYLCPPEEEFSPRNILKEKLRGECHSFILSEKKKLEQLFSLTNDLQERIQDLLAKMKKQQSYAELLRSLSGGLEGIAFRMYICDEDGFQLSPNLFRNIREWELQSAYIEKNWSWRPYFLENIIRMRYGKKGILSDRYSDIETGEIIRTFSCPLADKDFLFVDLSSTYLYSREGML
ncbi:EAL domain-containing protein [Mesobacillus harenae]|uniref:EAL domain-containing protein n=1 Tax=Mesobacillus harenae TaxID=2213203 RepID=UPI00158100D0|nr:EAL domain-containing protein [Mesobacillus harenae]